MDDATVLVMVATEHGFAVDKVDASGRAQPFLTAGAVGVGGIDGNTLAVDAAHHRLLLGVYSGTIAHRRDRRLIWVDLATRRTSPATQVALGALDAQLGATFGPGGQDVAFMTGRAGGGRYVCTILRGARRTALPGDDVCDTLAWG
jgi:hypothetical protein